MIQRLFRDWTKPMGFSLRSSETWPETSRNFMEDFPASHVWFQHLYECFGWPPTHLDNTVLYLSNYLFIDLVWYDLIYWLIDWLFWPLYWIYNFLYFGIVAGSPTETQVFWPWQELMNDPVTVPTEPKPGKSQNLREIVSLWAIWCRVFGKHI